MHEFICGYSAFRLLRTPPQVLALMPLFPDISYGSGKNSLRHIFTDAIGWKDVFGFLPIDTMVFDRGLRRPGKTVKTHLWSGELPTGSFWDHDGLDITASSPAFTLLTMAPSISVINLAMAMYELCGAFSVYAPSDAMQARLDETESQRLSWPGGWRQVRDFQGAPTSLWMRDPLIEIGELESFGRQVRGMRGSRSYLKALKLVSGVTASPLEVQASILLRAPRCMGGEGFPEFSNNRRIALSGSSRKLSDQTECYADIFFPGNGQTAGVDIECHGHMVHDGGAQGGIDANRALALQAMGIEVLHATSEQIADADRFDALCDHLAAAIGFRRLPKTSRMLANQSRLRAELFMDWAQLGR